MEEHPKLLLGQGVRNTNIKYTIRITKEFLKQTKYSIQAKFVHTVEEGDEGHAFDK